MIQGQSRITEFRSIDMTYYYITKQRSNEKHAGGKAPNDIDSLCAKRGWQRLAYPDTKKNKHLFYKRAYRSLLIRLFWIRQSLSMKPDSFVLYQHPMRSGARIAQKHIKELQEKKNIKFAVLIHDIDSIRYDRVEDGVLFEDNVLLKQFDAFICHNEHMKKYLIEQGIPADHIICLQVFDYLVDNDNVCDSDDGFVVAGNLDKNKCKYVYDLASVSPDIKVYAYGVNYEDDNKTNNMSYQGSYAPDELPSALLGRFGIIWDGDSIDSCSGSFGNYMKYNNPHKLSLYIAAGKPVICWKQAAIADFVLEHKIGIAVESLNEAVDIVKTLNDSSYCEMKSNVMGIREKVITGYYFNRAADQILELLKIEE